MPILAASPSCSLGVTGFHKFFDEADGWQSASELSSGDIVRGLDGEPIQVVSVARAAGTMRVYNMTVESDHVYFVGDLSTLTHNNGCIYEVPGVGTPSGKPYIGRHNQPTPETRSSADGRDRRQAKVIDTYDEKNVMEGRLKEQRAMDDRGGIDSLDNKRNGIRTEE